jgi:hypothetical protein
MNILGILFAPFRRLSDYIKWRRRDREETLVGTVTYTTNWTDTGETSEHHAKFLIDGNGVRYTRIDTGPGALEERAAKKHSAFRRDKFNWENHGDLPPYARRPDNRPRGKLIAIDGGAA